VHQILRAFVLALVGWSAGCAEAMAEEGDCSNRTDIVTDRPDVTNSSLVVPRGSLQVENGINWTARQNATVIDGSNSRLRVGVAHCIEVLFDLPDYFHALRGRATAGYSDFSPAIKRQLGHLPGDIELSATAGMEIPTGTARIAGSGYGAYIQFPWSKEIGGGWGLSGMFTAFLFSGEPASNPTLEQTFAIERQIGSRADFFAEYVADHPRRGMAGQVFDSGGGFRITPTQQIDVRAGVGLNRAAPDYLFGLGYSFRFDNVF
jgi:Putative MetA-pathway of phenol degradation